MFKKYIIFFLNFSLPTQSQDDTCPKDHKDEVRAVDKYDQVNKARVECLIIKSGEDQNPSIKSAVEDIMNLEAKPHAPLISGGKDEMNPNTIRQNLNDLPSEKQDLNVLHLKSAKIREVFSLQQQEGKVQEDQPHNLVKTNSFVELNQLHIVPRQAEITGDKVQSIAHQGKHKDEDVIYQLESIQQQDLQVQFDQSLKVEVLKEQESTKNCHQSDFDRHEQPIILSFEDEVDKENGLHPVDGIAVFNKMTNSNDECTTSCSSVTSELELEVIYRYFPTIFF